MRVGLSRTMSALAAQGAAIAGQVVTALTPDGIPHHAVTLVLALGAMSIGIMLARQYWKSSATKQFLSSAADRHHALPDMVHCCADGDRETGQHHAAGISSSHS